MRLLLTVFIGLSSMCLWSQDFVDQYLEKYKDLAISEMQRSGVPASITLAQGMLESDWGRSELSVQANNHFGIKCGGDWQGDEHYLHDDEFSSNGRAKKSCFRVFDTVYESYVAHSDFLSDPKKKNRYGFLFELEKEDYRSWAHGLSKAGYATDPKYAEKLIKIINNYELSQYDCQYEYEEVVDSMEKNNEYHDIVFKEGKRATIPKIGETAEDLASELGLPTRKLIVYNDFVKSAKQVLDGDRIVFLEQNNGIEYFIKDGKTVLNERRDRNQDFVYEDRRYIFSEPLRPADN